MISRKYFGRQLGMLLKQVKYLVVCGIVLVAMATFFVISGNYNYPLSPYDHHVANMRMPPKSYQAERRRSKPQVVTILKNATRAQLFSVDEISRDMSFSTIKDGYQQTREEQDFNKELNSYSFMNISTLPQNTVISDKKIVIIIAYMRTGSTLMGRLLEEHPGTFYLFEPIRSIWEAMHKKSRETTVSYLDGTKRVIKFDETIKIVLNEIINWITCKLHLQTVESLTDEFHRMFTTKMKLFYYCARISIQALKRSSLRNHPSRYLRLYASHKAKIYTCLKETSKTCGNSSLIAMKFIRLRMRYIKTLLPFFPNMKIIHLNRDPRGFVNSKLNLNMLSNASTEHARKECKNIASDLSVSKSILQDDPGRIKIVNYEDFAESPIDTAKEIYKFIGVNFTKSTIDFLKKMVSSKKDGCKFCTERKSSEATAIKWRFDMVKRNDFRTIKSIQDVCVKTNRIFGYLPFNTILQVNDTRYPSRQSFNVTDALLKDSDF